MKRIGIIGGGAAGMIAAIKASAQGEVYLLDGNDKCGKKLLLTGNGRCNYWNEDLDAGCYDCDSPEALKKILKLGKETLSFLETLGLYPKIKNGYYYPYSNQAASVRELLEKQLEARKVRFFPGFKVRSLTKKGEAFEIVSESGKQLTCDLVILATGSQAAPKTGSDGSGYDLAKKLGHRVNPVYPALTGLLSQGRFLKEWEKIRCDASVSLYIGGQEVKKDVGELQLTAKGISGICTFNLSGLAAKAVSRKEQVAAHINFMPHLEKELSDWLSERCEMMENPTLEQALETVFHYKLMFVLLSRAGVGKEERWAELSAVKKRALCDAVQNFSIEIVGTEDFEKAQTSTGGVPLSEINPETMESRLVPGLYFAGEILDADGRCGGYNLAFAFISGNRAGELMTE